MTNDMMRQTFARPREDAISNKTNKIKKKICTYISTKIELRVYTLEIIGSALSNYASFYIAKDERLSHDILNRSQHSGETNKDHLFFNRTRAEGPARFRGVRLTNK